MANIKIIYGTCGGNTEIVCERIKEIFDENGHNTTMIMAKVAKPDDLTGSDLLILASPTYGHGLLENFMDRLITSSRAINLIGQKSAVVGLGSFIYDMDYFIESEKILTDFLTGMGAEIICEPLKITRAPYPFLNKMVPSWTNDLLNKL